MLWMCSLTIEPLWSNAFILVLSEPSHSTSNWVKVKGLFFRTIRSKNTMSFRLNLLNELELLAKASEHAQFDTVER